MSIRGLRGGKNSGFLPKYEGKDGEFKADFKPAGRKQMRLAEVAKFLFLLSSLYMFYKTLFASRPLPTGADDSLSMEYYDLGEATGHSDGWQRGDRLLMCIPLRNAEPVMDMMWGHINNLTYPHNLIDIAFLVSDSDDDTLIQLRKHVELSDLTDTPFHTISIYEKDFGQIIGQGFSDRHGVKVQGQRRKLMGKARNWLLSAALKPYHSWVYWRDADIETAPNTLIQDLMHHGQDVIVPNVWRPLPEWLGGEQAYDLNSWQESDAARDLAKKLDEDEVIVEGYAEYATWRPHLAYFRNKNGNPEDSIDLDGIGGVSILARAKVFRAGANFPGFALWNHAETEAFGKMCRKMGFSVKGLVHYTVWHMYEPSEDDLKHEAEAKKKEEDAGVKKLSPVVDSDEDMALQDSPHENRAKAQKKIPAKDKDVDALEASKVQQPLDYSQDAFVSTSDIDVESDKIAAVVEEVKSKISKVGTSQISSVPAKASPSLATVKDDA